MRVLKQDYLPDDLSPLLESYDFSGSIAVQARGDTKENLFLLELAAQNPQILGIVGWLNFCDEDIENELSCWNSHSLIKGYRTLLQDEESPSDFLASKAFNRGIKALQKTGKVYELLISEKDLPAAIKFCSLHDAGPIVLCHMGKPDVERGSLADWALKLSMLAQLPHVFCKISGIVTEAKWCSWSLIQLIGYLEKAIEIFGTQRILYGSDWPVCLLSGTYSQVLTIAKAASYSFSDNELNLFWGENAARIYQL
jgi:L-fuconolactonase